MTTEVSTRGDAVARAERIRSGIRSLVELQQDITDAYHARDWQTLGYDTWEAYVAGEFGHALPKLDRAERRELVVSLRAEGLSTRAIASATGSSVGTVARNQSSTARLPKAVMIAYVIKAWNAYRAGESISLLRYRPGGANPEKFPEPK